MVDIATTGEVGFGILQNWIGIAATIVGFSVFTGIIWKISKKWTSIETKQDQQHACIERLEDKIDETVKVSKETKNDIRTDLKNISLETKEQTVKLAAIDEKVEHNDENSKTLAEGLEKTRDFFTKWLQRVEDYQRFGRPLVEMQQQPSRIEKIEGVVETNTLGQQHSIHSNNTEIVDQLHDIQDQIDRMSRRDNNNNRRNGKRGIFNGRRKYKRR